jgi:hypothetical protein
MTQEWTGIGSVAAGATTNFKGFDDFARRAPRLTRKGAEILGTELVEVTADEMADYAVSITPVGPDEEAQRRMAQKGGPAYGHMRDRWFKVVGGTGGHSGTKLPADTKMNLEPGQGVQVVNDAAHANVVDQGRKRLSTGRMGGSLQAKSGISKPVMNWALGKGRQFKKEALRRAERRMPKR